MTVRATEAVLTQTPTVSVKRASVGESGGIARLLPGARNSGHVPSGRCVRRKATNCGARVLFSVIHHHGHHQTQCPTLQVQPPTLKSRLLLPSLHPLVCQLTRQQRVSAVSPVIVTTTEIVIAPMLSACVRLVLAKGSGSIV